MSEYACFEGPLETLRWGRATYLILRVPEEVVAAMAGSRRAEGEIDDHPVNLALTRAAPVDGALVHVGARLARLARTLGVRPGDLLEARFAPARGDEVETPPDVAEALRAAEATPLWNALTPGRGRGRIHRIGTARREETRARHIAQMVASLGPRP